MIRPTHIKPLDSFQKFAADVFKNETDLFKNVISQDRDEVRVRFARIIAENTGAVDLRVVPLHMTDRFRFGVMPEFVSQIKAPASGRVYWAGYSLAKAQLAA